ncbi:MAG TPA: LysM peptidoglycan-binding domain-containing protein [Chloroflexota bacterium]|nr:LysM peptidoglycan-binding domain-containing protein [Chloroflexota bacterium]
MRRTAGTADDTTSMDYLAPTPDRRYPSPSAQRRNGEHWKARFGLGFVIILTLVSAAIMFRIAGLGVGTATSTLRGAPAQGPVAPNAAATAPSGTGQQAGNLPAVTPTPAPAVAPTSPPAASPTQAPPTPTTAPNQREHVVQSGDTLFAIANRYSTTIDAIVAANNMRSRSDPLSVGQRLIIPG